MTADTVTDRYFAAIRSRDIDSLIALYADDATFILPNGKAFVGKAAIREMHLGVFAAGAPIPSPTLLIAGEAAIAVEIEASLPDGTVRHTANHYQLNGDGLIQRLSVYVKTG